VRHRNLNEHYGENKMINYAPNRYVALGLVFLQIISGCSHLTKQDLSTSEDYKPTLKSHYSGETQLAVQQFPGKESGGFVTSVEKLWLNLINKTPDMGDATKVGAALAERTTLSISNEAKSYFYKETEDGYFPAEHEAILLHILSGFTFAAEGKRQEATIEARKAAFYLQNEYGAKVPFDDPALRLWLGTLWLYCGEWQHARVDFRVAAALSEKYSYLKKIADRETPPASVSLVLAGSGPQIYWTPTLKVDVLSGMQNLQFKTNYSHETFSLVSAAGQKSYRISEGISTLPWYDRHQERDHAIRKVLHQSRYTVEATGAATLAATTKAVGTALAVSIGAAGIAGGIAILYYTASYLNEVAGYLAIIVGGGGVIFGTQVYKSSSKTAKEILEEGLSPVDYYRYVRFLPDFVHLAVGDEREGPFSVKNQSGRSFDPLYVLNSPDQKTSVNVFYVPGGYYDPSKSKPSAQYVLKTRESAGWILAEEKLTFERAYRFCEKQAVQTGKKYRVPTASELKLAASKSFGNPQISARVAAVDTLWTKAPFIDSFTVCQHLESKTKTEFRNTSCSEKHMTICGDLGP